MNQAEDLKRAMEELRDRLSRLSEASLRINESLDFDTVLQEVVDSARALTASRYGAITVLGEAGRPSDFHSLRPDRGGAPGAVGHAGGAGIL